LIIIWPGHLLAHFILPNKTPTYIHWSLAFSLGPLFVVLWSVPLITIAGFNNWTVWVVFSLLIVGSCLGEWHFLKLRKQNRENRKVGDEPKQYYWPRVAFFGLALLMTLLHLSFLPIPYSLDWMGWTTSSQGLVKYGQMRVGPPVNLNIIYPPGFPSLIALVASFVFQLTGEVSYASIVMIVGTTSFMGLCGSISALGYVLFHGEGRGEQAYPIFGLAFLTSWGLWFKFIDGGFPTLLAICAVPLLAIILISDITSKKTIKRVILGLFLMATAGLIHPSAVIYACQMLIAGWTYQI